jgi:hypothetical protein
VDLEWVSISEERAAAAVAIVAVTVMATVTEAITSIIAIIPRTVVGVAISVRRPCPMMAEETTGAATMTVETWVTKGDARAEARAIRVPRKSGIPDTTVRTFTMTTLVHR